MTRAAPRAPGCRCLSLRASERDAPSPRPLDRRRPTPRRAPGRRPRVPMRAARSRRGGVHAGALGNARRPIDSARLAVTNGSGSRVRRCRNASSAAACVEGSALPMCATAKAASRRTSIDALSSAATALPRNSARRVRPIARTAATCASAAPARERRRRSPCDAPASTRAHRRPARIAVRTSIAGACASTAVPSQTCARTVRTIERRPDRSTPTRNRWRRPRRHVAEGRRPAAFRLSRTQEPADPRRPCRSGRRTRASGWRGPGDTTPPRR